MAEVSLHGVSVFCRLSHLSLFCEGRLTTVPRLQLGTCSCRSHPVLEVLHRTTDSTTRLQAQPAEFGRTLKVDHDLFWLCQVRLLFFVFLLFFSGAICIMPRWLFGVGDYGFCHSTDPFFPVSTLLFLYFCGMRSLDCCEVTQSSQIGRNVAYTARPSLARDVHTSVTRRPSA